MKYKARSIKLCEDPLEEELLPHQTLLHIYFQDRWGNSFKWTPKWLDVEKIMWRALQVEEKNSPGGVWSDELNRAAEQIPKLKQFKLPVRIKCSRLEETDEEGWRYRVEISILPDEAGVGVGANGDRDGFWIGDCHLLMTSLEKALFKKAGQLNRKLAISPQCDSIFSTEEWGPKGIRFFIWVEEGLEKTDYQILSRELAGVIRSYIRNVILDSKSIQKGFEET